MNISISVAATPCAMPQIMFAGDLEARCALLAGLGYDGIDMFFPDPQGTDARTAKAALDRNGLRATMLAAQGDLMADGLYLNDAGRLSELLERSKYHLEQCAVLGAMPNIGFIRGWHRNDPGSLPIDLCERAGKPANLGLLLDLFHMNIEEASVCGAICRAGSLVRHVHFVDNTRAVPGMGCMALPDVVACLKAVGYEGFLGIEAIPGSDPEGEARSGLAFTRALGV